MRKTLKGLWFTVVATLFLVGAESSASTYRTDLRGHYGSYIEAAKYVVKARAVEAADSDDGLHTCTRFEVLHVFAGNRRDLPMVNGKLSLKHCSLGGSALRVSHVPTYELGRTYYLPVSGRYGVALTVGFEEDVLRIGDDGTIEDYWGERVELDSASSSLTKSEAGVTASSFEGKLIAIIKRLKGSSQSLPSADEPGGR